MKELNQKQTLKCGRADPPIFSPLTAVQNKCKAAPPQKEHRAERGGEPGPITTDVVGTCSETLLTLIYSQFIRYEIVSELGSRLYPLVIQDRA